MKYCGFSQHEIDQITEILNSLRVVYEVSPYQAAIEAVNSAMKNDLRHLHGASLDRSLLQIEINDYQLKKIPPEYFAALEKLRIHMEHSPTELECIDNPEPIPQTLLSIHRKGFHKNLAILNFTILGITFLGIAAVIIFEYFRTKN